jgi:hypothetical protein
MLESSMKKITVPCQPEVVQYWRRTTKVKNKERKRKREEEKERGREGERKRRREEEKERGRKGERKGKAVNLDSEPYGRSARDLSVCQNYAR